MSELDNPPLPNQVTTPVWPVFVLVLHFLDIAADPEQLDAPIWSIEFGVTEILRAPRNSSSKRALSTVTGAPLAKTPLPAIAESRDGSFFILGKTADDKALIHDPIARTS